VWIFGQACKKTELDVTKWHNVTEVRVKQKRNEKLDREKPSSIPNLEGTRTSVTSVSNSNRSGRVGVAKAYTSDLIKCIYQIAGEPSSPQVNQEGLSDCIPEYTKDDD
jgi:hypothetical protein